MTAGFKRIHYPALDGLRGIAILLVVFYHNFGFINYFFFGWLGVDLFFVLSGYLITTILIETLEEKHFLKNFYIRRAIRIFPLYYLFLIFFLVIAPLTGLFHDKLSYYVENQGWIWFYMQNWFYSFHPPQNTQLLAHLWSLAVEEQFYLIWPFVILIIKKPLRLVYIMVFVLMTVMITRIVLYLYHVESLDYTTFYTFTRIDGLCVGCIIALLLKSNPHFITNFSPVILTSFALLNFAFYFLSVSSANSFPFYAFVGYTTFAAVFGIIVHYVITSPQSVISSLLSFKPLMFLGKISFGFYLFHWPIYVLFTPFLKDLLISFHPTNIVLSIISTIIAFLLSILSYYIFEKKFLSLKKYF